MTSPRIKEREDGIIEINAYNDVFITWYDGFQRNEVSITNARILLLPHSSKQCDAPRSCDGCQTCSKTKKTFTISVYGQTYSGTFRLPDKEFRIQRGEVQ